jgi:hypothetical protein
MSGHLTLSKSADQGYAPNETTADVSNKGPARTSSTAKSLIDSGDKNAYRQ